MPFVPALISSDATCIMNGTIFYYEDNWNMFGHVMAPFHLLGQDNNTSDPLTAVPYAIFDSSSQLSLLL